MKSEKWHFLTLFIVTYSLSIVTGCNNFFHDLIPPDGDRITSFIVEGQIDNAVISDNTITVMVEKGTNIHALIPRIQVSEGASIIPITLNYIKAAFPGADLMKEAMTLYTTSDLPGYVRELIKQNPDFNVPAINIPIDFSWPVSFFVISGQGSMREYIVRVTEDTRRPQIYAMRFAKYDNPELVIDALCLINESAKTITAQASYPVEMDYLSYALVPSFEILGDSVEFDGVLVESEIDTVQFAASLDAPQTAIVTVKRGTESVDYNLTIMFAEDPDTVRSITDFRFTKADNSPLAANAVATIINTGSTGAINVTVFYSGSEPSWLIPRFVSPGTVSVGGATQTTGVTGQDFSSQLEYRVVSRNGQYTRLYTVKVAFVSLSADAPRITSFGFSHALNPDLVQDTAATINHDAGLIIIDAYYGGLSAPETLVPEFTAEGLVKALGSVQLSGASAQDFRREIRYTVTNPENDLLKREYRVQTRLARDTSSDASITAFGFYPLDNPGLADALTAKIDQVTGKISLYAPIGSGITQRVMIPRFTAAGTVSVNDAPQVSGTTGQTFDAPLIYTVKSANDINTRDYTVDVRELMSTIYVKHDAHGQNDGTNWTDAFISLQAACEAALQFPEDVPKELWIAVGTYKPSTSGNSEEYFPLTANTSYIGGFAGGETSKSERNVAANKVIISGDLGGGVYSSNLFGNFSNDDTLVTINGDLFFEDMEFTAARASGSGGRGIDSVLSSNSELRITDCNFNNLQFPDGGMVYISGGSLVISDTVVTNNTVKYGIYGSDLSGVRISDLALQDMDYGLYFFSCPGDMEINRIDLQNITNDGIYISGSGRRELSGITGNNIRGTNGLYVSGGNSVTLTNSSFDTTGRIFLGAGGSSSKISNTDIKNVSGLNGLYISGGNNVIDGVTVKNVPNGRGMYISGGMSYILSCTIKNTKISGDGGGMYISGTASIEDSIFEDCKSDGVGGALSYSGVGGQTLTVVNTDFINCTAKNSNKIFSGTRGNNFRAIECRFIHNNALYIYDMPELPWSLNLFGYGGYYEDCTFTNLMTANTEQGRPNYYFTRYHYWSNSSGGWYGGYNTGTDSLTLKGCVFNFKSDEMQGIALMIGGYDYLMLDNITVNTYNEQQPLISFNANPDEFHIKLNNHYNGMLLDTAAKISDLVNRGVLSTNGTQTIIP